MPGDGYNNSGSVRSATIESGLLRYYDNVRPLSYSFSDGIKTITQADYQPFFDFGTDSSVSINA
jgi:hypothetical protein